MEPLTGTVIKITGSASLVDAGEDGCFRCDLRGRLLRKKGVRLAVGDRVRFLPQDEAAEEGDGDEQRHGVIEAVEPRGPSLRRSRDFKRDQVVCANVDQVMLVLAVIDPPYKRAFIDRVLVAVERDELEGVIVFNKIDLIDGEYRDLVEDDANVYRELGYRAHLTSAADGEGVADLAEALAGRVTAVVGPSGVGKSTLLNEICPAWALRTADVSQVDGRGKHTTTAAELLALPQGGYVADTPGVRAFGLWDLSPSEIEAGFREIANLGAHCRFRDCAHRSEPGCQVLEALEQGVLDEERYHSYLRLREDAEADDGERQNQRRR